MAHGWGRDEAASPRREVEGVVVEDDAVLVLSVAAHAMLKRMSQNKEATTHHRVPRVLFSVLTVAS